MATTVKEGSLGKEKTRLSPSAPQNQDSPRGKRATKSFNPDSSEKGLAIQKDKSTTPHYLKHTVSSAKDVCMYGKKQASDDTNLKYSSSRRRSIEPSPPPQSTLKRTLSANTRGTTPPPPVKPSTSSSSPITKNAVSNKNGLGKTSKSLRSGKSQPVLTRPASIKKSAVSSSTTTSKKEAKSKISSAQKNSSKSDVTEKQEVIIKPEQEEDKDASAQDVVGEEEPITIMTEEGTQDDIQQTHDQMEPESTNPEDEKHNDAYDSSSLSEEREVNSNDTIQEQEEKGREVPENDNMGQGDEAQDKVTGELSSKIEEAGKNENGSEVESKNGEELMEKSRSQAEKVAPLEDGSEGNTTPRKLNFRKVKELEKMEADCGTQKLKYKERAEETQGNVEAKSEQDNVVLKRQDVQGKKESPAYNDVIEETASKLVGKRKSKVKALVGAFETVISLENESQQTEDT